MPHFCHIMTNNILPEILFSITPRHTFLFLSYFIYNKKFIRIKNTQSLKNIPWKGSRGCIPQRRHEQEKRVSRWTNFPLPFKVPREFLLDPLPYPHFHSPSMRQNEGLRKRLVRTYPYKGKPEKSGFCRVMFPPQKRAMGKDAQARLKKGSSPLPLSSKFWITLIPEKHVQPGKKLSPPFNGI